ncbi:unnamed protein product [Penicillium viridicatum]
MSSEGSSRDPVNNDPKATTSGPKPVEDYAQRLRQRDALVVLNEVIRKLIMERRAIENDIIHQRAVLDDQIARLSATDENIQTLQTVWEDMAAGFGHPFHNTLPIDSIGHLLVPFTHHAFDLPEDPTSKIAGALGNEHLEWLDEENLLGAEEKVLEYLRDVLRHEEEST